MSNSHAKPSIAQTLPSVSAASSVTTSAVKLATTASLMSKFSTETATSLAAHQTTFLLVSMGVSLLKKSKTDASAVAHVSSVKEETQIAPWSEDEEG